MIKLFIALTALFISSCSIGKQITQEENYADISILFIGSSYFVYNNLPDIFEQLTNDVNKNVSIYSCMSNGLFLADHAEKQKTEDMINQEDWDFIVLQGVGSLMAYPDKITHHPIKPALIKLQEKIYSNSNSTKIVYCLPWAFEDGMTWLEGWTDNYSDMQLKIKNNTLEYAEEIGFDIAPVGVAWHTVLQDQNYPLHYLHLSDWNHPSMRGSYLMACTIYATLYQESLEDVKYYAGLPENETSYFQTVASRTVINNLELWNLGNKN